MASLIFRSTEALLKNAVTTKWAPISCANLRTSTPSNAQKDAVLKNEVAFLTQEEQEQKQKLQGYITVQPTNISVISGVPVEQVKTRKVRIFIPPKNAMQSGTDNTHHWEIEFDNKQRWENPLMGWCSTGDPVSNLKVPFGTKDEAVRYCETNGWQYYIDEGKLERPFKPKSYGVNFSWNKRTRVSTK